MKKPNKKHQSAPYHEHVHFLPLPWLKDGSRNDLFQVLELNAMTEAPEESLALVFRLSRALMMVPKDVARGHVQPYVANVSSCHLFVK